MVHDYHWFWKIDNEQLPVPTTGWSVQLFQIKLFRKQFLIYAKVWRPEIA